MSKDSVIILLTSISSWFNLSIFSLALTSLKSFLLRLICFSRQWYKNAGLTELNESILTVNSLYFWLVVNTRLRSICVLQLTYKTVIHFVQKHKCQLLWILWVSQTQVNHSTLYNIAAHNTCLIWLTGTFSPQCQLNMIYCLYWKPNDF